MSHLNKKWETTMNNLNYLIGCRRNWICQLQFCNKYCLPKGVVMSYLGKTTRDLTNEIRRVEKMLGVKHRYLPKAGFFQGVV